MNIYGENVILRAIEEQDAALLRNILYSGVWSRYAYLQQKRKEKKQ